MNKTIFLVLGLVFIAGCVQGFPGFRSQTGTTEFPPDIISVSSKNIIPNPVSALDIFTVSFEIKNVDNVNEVNNVNVQLFDWGLCEPNLDSAVWSLSQGIYVHNFGNLAPQQTEFIEWQFTAPSNDQIANLPAKCPIRFKVVYDFVANTQTDLLVISSDRLSQLQRAGQTPTFTPNQIIGRGPIKINIEFGTNLPIRTSSGTTSAVCEGVASPCSIFEEQILCNAQSGCTWSGNTCNGVAGLCLSLDVNTCESQLGCNLGDIKTTLTQNSTLPIFVTIDDKGSGVLSNININRIFLTIPDSFTPIRCDKFGPVVANTWSNNATIPMIKKKSPTVRCSFAMPTKDIVAVEKTYFIFGNMSYTYDLDDEMTVNVRPSLGG